MSKKIVLISCVSQKLEQRAKVKDLYVSTLFKLNFRYAISMKPDAIYILSAKYGLLHLDQEVEPYERTLNNMRASEIKDWANKVISQLREVTSLKDDSFTFLAGEKYRKYLLPLMNKIAIPLEGLPIGKQLQRLKELTE
jgi:hypothetical protein